MSKFIRVSVCVITYNHALYLEKCLESLLSQETDFHFEIVIRDDASQDQTIAIIKHFQAKHPGKINLLPTLSNLGMTANLMNVLEAAQGDYLAICEGDDYWLDKCKLQKQVLALEQYPNIDICCHPAHIVGKKHPFIMKYLGNYRKHISIISATEVIQADGAFIATPSIMLRKRVLSRLPRWLLTAPVADYFIQVYGSLRGGCLFLPEPMAAYRRYAVGSWTTMMKDIAKKKDFLEHYMICLQKMQESLDDTFEQPCRRIRARGLCSLALTSVGGHFGMGFKEYIQESWRCYQKLSAAQLLLYYLRFSPKLVKLIYSAYRRFMSLA